MNQKRLIVPCPTPDPNWGSEPGKAFFWTLALSKYFEVHVYCLARNAALCQADPRTCDWVFHPLSYDKPEQVRYWWRDWYPEWRKRILFTLQQDLPRLNPVGLHHSTPGTFRIFPAYHRLGIPYTLGPLGGGEFTPVSLLHDQDLPLKQLLLERSRPKLNRLSASHAWSRPVLKGAEHTLATTEQSAAVLRTAGVQSVATCFPDVVDVEDGLHIPQLREQQLQEIRESLILVFSGRALWWKGGHLVLEVLREAVQRGLRVKLHMITQGEAETEWKARADRMGLSPLIQWSRFCPREELLERLRASHVYVYPTMHDSSSSALPEAYSTGLPSMTLGIGGAGTASAPGVGFNEFRPTTGEWVTAVVDQLHLWQEHPEEWLQCSQKALARSRDFTQEAIEKVVERELVPVYG